MMKPERLVFTAVRIEPIPSAAIISFLVMWRKHCSANQATLMRQSCPSLLNSCCKEIHLPASGTATEQAAPQASHFDTAPLEALQHGGQIMNLPLTAHVPPEVESTCR